MTVNRATLSTVLAIVVSSGCSSLAPRSHVGAVTTAEEAFFDEAASRLAEGRKPLLDALDRQHGRMLDANAEAVEARKELATPESMVQSKASALTVAQTLSPWTEADVAGTARALRLDTEARDRIDGIVSLYEAVRGLLELLRQNQLALNDYVSSGDLEFFARSIDRGAVATAITQIAKAEANIQVAALKADLKDEIKARLKEAIRGKVEAALRGRLKQAIVNRSRGDS